MRRQLGTGQKTRVPLRRDAISAVLAIALFCASGIASKRTALRSGEYRNPDHGYGVRVPKGLRYEVSRPPAPNHGFTVSLPEGTLLWVDGSYTDDADLSAATDSEREVWRGSCREQANAPTVLGPLPARRITFSCLDGSPGHPPTVVTVVLALLGRPGNGIAEYEFGFRSPMRQEPEDQAQRLLDQLIHGFFLLPMR